MGPITAKDSFNNKSLSKVDYVDYKNIDPIIGLVVSSNKATLHELKTVYSLEDLYDLYEIILIDKYNKYLSVKESQKAENKR